MPQTEERTERLERIRRSLERSWPHLFEYLGATLTSLELGHAHHCFLHEDAHPSLGIYEKDGRVRWRCHSRCAKGGDLFEAWAQRFNIDPKRLPAILEDIEARYPWIDREPDQAPAVRPATGGSGGRRRSRGARRNERVAATYDYADRAGGLLFQVLRKEWEEEVLDEDGNPTGEWCRAKTFLQRRPPGEGEGDDWIWSVPGSIRVPYRLPELESARAVYLVEGEKDVETMRERLGLPATCIVGGARAWQDHYPVFFESKVVVLVPDLDEEGEALMWAAGKGLAPVVRELHVIDLPEDLGEKADVTDWVEAQGDVDQEELRRRWKEMAGECRRPWRRPEPEPPPRSEPPPEPPRPEPKPPDNGYTEEDRSPEEEAIQRILEAPGPLAARLASIGRIAISSAKEARDKRRSGPPFISGEELWPEDRVEPYVRRGPSTGIEGLDAITYGIRSGWWVVRGESGLGKSTLVNSWVHESLQLGARWLIVPLEDSPGAWRTMMLARLSGVNGKWIATGEYPNEELRQRVLAQLDCLRGFEHQLSFPRTDFYPLTVSRFVELVDAWWESLADDGFPRGIVLDPVQGLAPASPTETKYDRVEAACAHIQGMVERYDIPFITPVHLNRAKQELGSTAFEFSAHVRVLVEVGEEAKRINDGLEPVEREARPYLDLVVQKNKGLPTGKIITRYDRAVATWTEKGFGPDGRPDYSAPF